MDRARGRTLVFAMVVVAVSAAVVAGRPSEASSANVEEEFAEELCPGTVYHFRVAAKSKVGTTYGKDRTFKTRGAARRHPHNCA